jgi:hypothetical protein
VSFLKITQTADVRKLYRDHHIAQDMLVPIDKLVESVQGFHDLCDVYPIWVNKTLKKDMSDEDEKRGKWRVP